LRPQAPPGADELESDEKPREPIATVKDLIEEAGEMAKAAVESAKTRYSAGS